MHSASTPLASALERRILALTPCRGTIAPRIGGAMLRTSTVLLFLLWLVDAKAQASPDAGLTPGVQAEAAMTLPEEVLRALQNRKADRMLPLRDRIQRLVDFMVAEDGLALRYQEQPTYGIADSYSQRKVNCLSFTLMFIAMARASGINAYAQASDDALAMHVLGDTMYRATHVNAGVEVDRVQYTVDVGWRSMLASRRPRVITDVQAVALLRNNNAVERLLVGDKVGATTEIEGALALDPASPAAWSNAGVVYWRSGRRADAEHAYHEALRLQRTHLGALSNMVVLYRDAGDAKSAESYMKRLERAQAVDPFSQFLIAQGLADSGAYSDAILHYRRAIRLLPGQPQFHRSLADAYQKQGNAAAAERARHHAGMLEARQESRRGIRDAGDPGPG